jgi:Transposase, Mutator family
LLKDTDYVYLWVDGIHLKVRLEQDKVCLLVMIAVRVDGTKELVALTDGFRESSESWADLLRDCKRCGMRTPVLAVGDGALGFWKALREVFPQTKEQRCWFRVQGNVLAALPKSAHPGAKAALTEIFNAEDKDHALKAAKAFEADYGASGPRRSPRSPTTSTCCSRSTTSPPSTGSTSVRPTPSSRPSPPSGSGSGSPKAPAPEPPKSRWPSSSSSPPGPDGAPSTPLTWSRWSEPARGSRRASSSNAQRNEVTPTPRDTPINRS